MGDRLAVWRFNRLRRNVPHLMKLAENAEDIENRGCQLVSLTEKLNTDIPGEKLVFMVFAAPAQIRV